jgi:hypothetical protein
MPSLVTVGAWEIISDEELVVIFRFFVTPLWCKDAHTVGTPIGSHMDHYMLMAEILAIDDLISIGIPTPMNDVKGPGVDVTIWHNFPEAGELEMRRVLLPVVPESAFVETHSVPFSPHTHRGSM